MGSVVKEIGSVAWAPALRSVQPPPEKSVVYCTRYVLPGYDSHSTVTTAWAETAMRVKRGGPTTTRLNVFMSLAAGLPSSVTRTATALVPGAWALGQGPVNKPFVGLMLAPAGAPGSRVKKSFWAGASVSLAVAVKVSVLPSVTAWGAIGLRVGAAFTSLTVMLMVSKSSVMPSLTRTVTG